MHVNALLEFVLGLTPDTKVKLGYNQITNIGEEVFRPLLEAISQGAGVLHLESEFIASLFRLNDSLQVE